MAGASVSRTGTAPRVEHDVYPTPAWCVRRMLEAAPWRDYATWPRSPLILEPAAGEGAIVRELCKAYPRAEFLMAFDVRNTRAELKAAGASCAVTGDARDLIWDVGYDLAITNPPFELWPEFAKRGIVSARWCALLLRVGALAHTRRQGLPTPSVYVLPNRPSFVALWRCDGYTESKGVVRGGAGPLRTPCGWQEYRDPHESTRGKRCPSCGGKISRTASDGSEYAWLVWGPQAPTVVILPDTPQHERKGLVPEAA